VFGKGNDFAAKITYSAKDPRQLLQAFRTSPTLRIAVTVDMIATGTDVKPLECVFFMRDVRSASYFEQMKGRGSRTIPDTDFQVVTPDATAKTRFVIVDAVGVTEHDYVDAAPLDREKKVLLKDLLGKAANLTITEPEVATLASRLARLERQLTDSERAELASLTETPLHDITRGLVDAIDPDRQARAIAEAPSADPATIIHELLMSAIQPLAANPPLRARIVEIRQSHDLVIDELSRDTLLDAHGVVDTEKARHLVQSWSQYIEDHKDEIAALHVLYSQPKTGRVAYAQIRELAERIKRPPYSWTPDLLWNAYEAVDGATVRHSDRHVVTDLITLVRYALGQDDQLVPYPETVQQRYVGWLLQQEQAGVTFTERQRWWLDRIAEVIATSAGITTEDLDNAPFAEHGGLDAAAKILGPGAQTILDQLNVELTA